MTVRNMWMCMMMNVIHIAYLSVLYWILLRYVIIVLCCSLLRTRELLNYAKVHNEFCLSSASLVWIPFILQLLSSALTCLNQKITTIKCFISLQLGIFTRRIKFMNNELMNLMPLFRLCSKHRISWGRLLNNKNLGTAHFFNIHPYHVVPRRT